MAQLDRHLAPGENMLLHSHPHAKTLIKPVFFALLISAVAVGVYVVLNITEVDGLARTIILGIVGAVWAIAVVWLLVIPLMKWGTTHFAVTDRRIIFRHGIITKSGIDIPIARINSVQFRHDFIDRIFKAGTLIVESASDEPLEFADIPKVEKVHALLYDRLNDVLTDDDGNARA